MMKRMALVLTVILVAWLGATMGARATWYQERMTARDTAVELLATPTFEGENCFNISATGHNWVLINLTDEQAAILRANLDKPDSVIVKGVYCKTDPYYSVETASVEARQIEQPQPLPAPDPQPGIERRCPTCGQILP